MKTEVNVLRRLLFWPLMSMAATAPAQPVQESRVVLWQLKPLGLEEATASRLEQMLRGEMRMLPGIKMVEPSELEQMLAQPQHSTLSSCTGQLECLCDIGRVLGAHKVVTGVISALGENYILDLKMVDVATGSEAGRLSEELGGREEILIGAIRAALYRLMVPRLFSGSLRVEVAIAGAEVLLDDRTVGTTPLAGAIAGLAPGRHRLAIRKAGFKQFAEEVEVRFQQVTVVRVDLSHSALMSISYQDERAVELSASAHPGVERRPPRGYRIAAWTTAGLAVAAAVAGGLASWRTSVLEDRLAAAARDGKLDSSYQSLIDRGERWAFWANVGWGTAAGAAALSTLFFVLGWSGTGTQVGQAVASTPPVSFSLGWSF